MVNSSTGYRPSPMHGTPWPPPCCPQCGVALAAASPLLCAQELESTAALCFKATEGSTEVVRSSVAELLAQLLIASQQPLPPHQRGKVRGGTGHWPDCKHALLCCGCKEEHLLHVSGLLCR